MLVVSAGFAVVALAAMSSIVQAVLDPDPDQWHLRGDVSHAADRTIPGAPVGGHSRHRTRRPASNRGGWTRAGVASRRVRSSEPLSLWRKRPASPWRWPPPHGCFLTRASSETEERVFAVSALLLVGGVAAALSLSALFGGLVAGVFWRYAGRHPREHDLVGMCSSCSTLSWCSCCWWPGLVRNSRSRHSHLAVAYVVAACRRASWPAASWPGMPLA